MVNAGDAFPAGEDYLVRRIKDVERRVSENASARSLAASQIGSGGLLINGGGSLTISGGGSLNVAGGALNSAGAISAGTTITAGTTIAAGGAITGASVAVTGAGTFGTDVTAAAGSVTGLNVLGTSIFAANAGNIAGNISATRTTTWARNSDGYIGNTLSSIRFKTDVVGTDIDPLAVLAMSVKHYRYIAELRTRDDKTYEGYVGPGYHVALEVGMIAEEMHAAGLWQFVVYERHFDEDGAEHLTLDANGQVIPQSIHYTLWGMAVLIATQHVWAEHLKVRADTDRILAHLGI